MATHGRSFWLLDDVGVLQQIADVGDPSGRPYKDAGEAGVKLLKPGVTERHLPKVFEGLFDSGDGKQYMSTLGMVAAYVKEETPEHGVKHTYLDSGTNPPKGAVVTYYLAEKPEATITLRIDDADGNEVKSFQEPAR